MIGVCYKCGKLYKMHDILEKCPECKDIILKIVQN